MTVSCVLGVIISIFLLDILRTLSLLDMVTSELTSSKDFPFSSASWIIFAAFVRGGMFCAEEILKYEK